jgi:hypothetical protein
MFVYVQSEPGLWTVGHYDPGSKRWHAESDHRTAGEAAYRCSWLNGCVGRDEIDNRVRTVVELEMTRRLSTLNSRSRWSS